MSLQADGPSSGQSIDFDNFYPALISIFGTILLGYIVGRCRLISEVEAKGINTFIGYLSLPALIFTNMVRVQLGTVNWWFLLAVLLGKLLVFIGVVVVHLLVVRPVKYGAAGMLGIVATQSNDFAIGYPIVNALYERTHPNFAAYLYLVTPISLAIVNPIGLALIELERRNSGWLRLLVSIYTNPVIFMTLLGIVANLIFGGELPKLADGMLTLLGNAFPACALFTLGVRMVGQMHLLQGRRLLTPALLIAAKLLILPLIIRQLVRAFPGDVDDAWSTFGFLYGALPAAPIVFVFAVQYGVHVELVAATLVACTFVAAPWLFVSARMIAAPAQDYAVQLAEFVRDVCIVGLIASGLVLGVLGWTRRWTRKPHKFVVCLIFAQVLICTGTLLQPATSSNTSYLGRMQLVLVGAGTYASQFWTALLAVTLVFLELRDDIGIGVDLLLGALEPYFMLCGWAVPVLISSLGLLFNNDDYRHIVTLSLLVMCFILSAGCLVFYQRYKHTTPGEDEEALHSTDDPNTSTIIERDDDDEMLNVVRNQQNQRISVNASYDDNGGGDTLLDVSDERRIRCDSSHDEDDLRPICSRTTNDDDDIDADDPQLGRHLILVLFQLVAMFVSGARLLWSLVGEPTHGGLYAELAFLDAGLQLGATSIVACLLFGLFTPDDDGRCLAPWWRRWWWNRGDADVISAQCDEFRTHHLTKCIADIATTVRDRKDNIHEQAFTGRQLVDWLVDVELASTRSEATSYARTLLAARILHPIDGTRCRWRKFHDRRSKLYTFAD